MFWPEVTVSLGASRLLAVTVLVLEILRSVHCGVTLTLAVLLAVPPGGFGALGLVNPDCTEVPSVNPVGVVMLEVFWIAAHVRPAKAAVTV